MSLYVAFYLMHKLSIITSFKHVPFLLVPWATFTLSIEIVKCNLPMNLSTIRIRDVKVLCYRPIKLNI